MSTSSINTGRWWIRSNSDTSTSGINYKSTIKNKKQAKHINSVKWPPTLRGEMQPEITKRVTQKIVLYSRDLSSREHLKRLIPLRAMYSFFSSTSMRFMSTLALMDSIWCLCWSLVCFKLITWFSADCLNFFSSSRSFSKVLIFFLLLREEQ